MDGSFTMIRSLDLSPFSLLPDLANAAQGESVNPLVNSGDRLNDAGNMVEMGKKGAEALSKTLPFLGPVAKKLGVAWAVISVGKAARDFYECAR